jgi:hypothetical protein
MSYLVKFRILDKDYTDPDHPMPVSYGVVVIQDTTCTTDRSGRCTAEVREAGEFPVWFRHENYRPFLDPPYIVIPTEKEYVLKATRARF